MSAITACPECGTESSEDYGAIGTCWECSQRPRTTWAPVPLAAILSGDHVEPTPSILRRSDGRCLLYPERAHALHGERCRWPGMTTRGSGNFEIGVRTYNALIRAGLDTIGKVQGANLWQIAGVGPKCQNEIDAALMSYRARPNKQSA